LLWLGAVHVRVMDAALSRIMAAQHGFFYRRQALDCGVGPKELQALVTSGEWVRLRRGAFTTKAAHTSLDAGGLHVLHLRAITGNLTGRVVAAGVSALAVLGVPLWGLDLEVVHVLRDPGVTSRTDA